MIESSTDLRYMTRALRLARGGRGTTSPNPMVGAVVVHHGRIVGQGYHRRAGEPHAEILALHAAGRRSVGATLYVTLEPCCHTRKRTPPCVPVVLESGIERIVVAMLDPNPAVRGRGVAALRRAGRRVDVGCLEAEARRLNEAYMTWIETGRPFVILKMAMTLDGKTATARGTSRWITGEAARRDVHRLRSQVDAIMVGVGTVLADDPQLTVRHGIKPGRQPARIVLDSRLRIPLTARVLTAKGGETIVATTARAAPRRVAQLEAMGVRVWRLPEKGGRVSLPACLRRMGREGMTTVLIEGGSEVAASALDAQMIDRIRLYVAPVFMGGADAKGLIGGAAPEDLSALTALHDVRISRIGCDWRVEGTVAGRPTLRRRTRLDTP